MPLCSRNYNIDMFEQGGLIRCGQQWSNSFCVTKLIEAITSLLLIIFVLYEIVKMRLTVGRWVFGFVLWIQILIILTLLFNILYAVFHFVATLLDFQILFQDLYYTLLLFYVGYNVLNNQKRIRIFFYVCIVGFSIIYIALFVTRIVTQNIGKSCQSKLTCYEALQFIIIDGFTIIVSLFLITIFAYQYKKQQQLQQIENSRRSIQPAFQDGETTKRKDSAQFCKKQNFPLMQRQKQNNPFRMMWLMVIVNACCAIIMQLESVFFAVISDEKCQIRKINYTATGIIQLFFSIFGFELAFLVTICVFRNKRKMKEYAIQDIKRRSSDISALQTPNCQLQLANNYQTKIEQWRFSL